MKTPKSIKRFVDIFSTLPGVGPRQAIRLAFYFLRQGKAFQDDFVRVVEEFKNIDICKQCFYIAEEMSGPASPESREGGLCVYCGDKNRNQSLIAIVEKETDIMSIENTGKYNGRYLVLGDIKRSGILETDQKLRLQSLKKWIEKELGGPARQSHDGSSRMAGGKADEIIVAINPTAEGEILAGIVSEEMRPVAKKVTRLGRGIPTGGEIEFADEDTLGSAIERRG